MSDMMETTKQQDAWYKACRRVGNDNMLSIGTWVAAYVDERLAADAKQSQPDEPRAEGDVPEWCLAVAAEICVTFHDNEMIARKLYAAAESELTRRVAEATAELQAKFDTQTKCAQKYADEVADLKAKALERDRRIAELEKENARLGREILASGRLSVANDALKQQLAASQAEVEWLSRPVEGITERMKCHCNVAEQTAEIAQRERNAREAAEAERDELREVVKVRFLHRGEHLINEERVVKISDAELDAVLTAYRAEKGKVQQ